MTTNMDAVTDLPRATGVSSVVAEALVAAESAARSAAVQVRQLDSSADLRAVRALFDEIWGTDGSNSQVSNELMRALVKTGSYVGGAFDDGQLVGACIGFFAPPAHEAMHSHIAGVSPRARGRSVGFALKVHQRAWAMLHGVDEISWTFDPLVRRNAYFNIGKLATNSTEYLTNFYGPMTDGINGGDETDRLLVTWRLDDAEVAAACAGKQSVTDAAAARSAGAMVALEAAPDGSPRVYPTDAPSVLVATPADIEALRPGDPGAASAWRLATREVLGGLLTAGARVRGFDRAGWYLVDRSAA